MGASKFVFGGEVKFDISGDTVSKDTLLKGYTAHGSDGELIDGECTFDVDSSGATATASDVAKGKTFGKGGKIHEGTMPVNGAVSGIISTKDGKYTIPFGSHDGSGTVQIDANEQAKLIPSNIRSGVDILGVHGEMSGSEDINAQAKAVTPAKDAQVVLPDDGYNYLTQVTVAGIPYEETENAGGGITITIG